MIRPRVACFAVALAVATIWLPASAMRAQAPASADGPEAAPSLETGGEAAIGGSSAGGGAEEPSAHAPRQLSDLTLLNFFTEGWNQPWAKRPRYTPDMALLKVTTNFLEREFRLDYVLTNVANNANLDTTDLANALIAYGLNRRLMIEVISNYQWNNPPVAPTVSGASGGFLARFQLVDTETQSYSFQTRVTPANKGIGGTQTSMTYALAGWQDMHALIPALGRFGLYGSFQYENLIGPHKAGAMENDVSYDLSIAETWTQPTTPVFGNFTTFLEAFGQTPLDGASSGKTTVSLTPGIRFWFVPENSFTVGVDLPVTTVRSFHSVVRATYILNF
ncbi:MAG TPA: hypothetical protein VEG84_05830 [Thermoanaerobaculia bacterium]|nr:hypothetical protein [Thermoanaerobaculia bacterium]